MSGLSAPAFTEAMIDTGEGTPSAFFSERLRRSGVMGMKFCSLDWTALSHGKSEALLLPSHALVEMVKGAS